MTQKCTHCSGPVVDDVCEDCGRPAKKNLLVQSGTGGIEPITTVHGAASRPTTGRTRSSTRFAVNYPTRSGTGASSGTTGAKSTRRRAGVSSHTSTRRNALGGGLISLPDLPSQDPLKLLMSVPEVPAHKRHCTKCDALVSRVKGFCSACGTPYDFVPRLKAGDVIAGKYEIKGPIAFGGLGWIYLGWDTVLQRWVVLKGLLNANDEASAAAAVAERRYLAAVKHPKIVGIYDFLQHGAEGFIIMEYVGGQTVHSLRKQRGPLPVSEAIAYVLGIVPAFSYLHAQGLVYCDFKPDNLMIEGGDVKLIDMGAVRKIGDPGGDIFATVGFAAPEASDDPIAVSDLYTIGRALAMLIMDFKFSTDFEHSLPSPDEQPVLAENESLYRFLLRATHVDPDERFQCADDMGDQLLGVLREIVSLQTGPKPVDSKVFTGDRMLHADIGVLIRRPDPASLPMLRVNLDDRAANEVIRVLSLMDPRDQLAEFAALASKYGDASPEARLRLAEVQIQNVNVSALGLDKSNTIEQSLAAIEAADPFDWRPSWLRGVWMLIQDDGAGALAQFERCYFEMPGELAPRLGMGLAAEMAGHADQALPYYDRVGQVDPGCVTAHVGAARCLSAAGHVEEALKMLQRVPSNHTMRVTTQLAIGEMILAHPDRADRAVLAQADAAVGAALPTGGVAHRVAGRLLALAVTLAPRLGWSVDSRFLGAPCKESSLRLGAEEQFRKAAKLCTNLDDRVRWVGLANQIRPVTLF